MGNILSGLVRLSRFLGHRRSMEKFFKVRYNLSTVLQRLPFSKGCVGSGGSVANAMLSFEETLLRRPERTESTLSMLDQCFAHYCW